MLVTDVGGEIRGTRLQRCHQHPLSVINFKSSKSLSPINSPTWITQQFVNIGLIPHWHMISYGFHMNHMDNLAISDFPEGLQILRDHEMVRKKSPKICQ